VHINRLATLIDSYRLATQGPPPAGQVLVHNDVRHTPSLARSKALVGSAHGGLRRAPNSFYAIADGGPISASTTGSIGRYLSLSASGAAGGTELGLRLERRAIGNAAVPCVAPGPRPAMAPTIPPVAPRPKAPSSWHLRRGLSFLSPRQHCIHLRHQLRRVLRLRISRILHLSDLSPALKRQAPQLDEVSVRSLKVIVVFRKPDHGQPPAHHRSLPVL
jgi:hypothetical protein